MNIWALYSFIAGVINFILGVYVYCKNPRHPLNRIFALFAFSLALWGISEFGHRIANNPETAILWIKAGGFGWCFMVGFYIHFALLFARKTNYLKRISTYIILYAPCLLFLHLFLSTDLIYKQEVEKMYWGYTSFPGKFVWFYTTYYMLSYFWGIYLFIQVLKYGTPIEKKQVKPMFLGYTTTLIIGTISNVIFPFYGVLLPELGTIIALATAIGAFYSIFRYKLFIIPVKESDATVPLMFDLEKGTAYFTKEESSDRAYKIFIDQVSHGIPGLCFSKFPPEKIRKKYKILYTPIIHITLTGREKDTIGYKDTKFMSSTILDFIEKTKTATIFLDCLNEIIMINGWEKTVSWLEELKKKCTNSVVLLFSINTELLDSTQGLYLKENLRLFSRG
ncbi:MAG: histidine kinase N-terminal 7TM domain-containing protein [bacterium]|nr:histidine kinase N-terminal 7TM domain-containing protein [bacterium]